MGSIGACTIFMSHFCNVYVFSDRHLTLVVRKKKGDTTKMGGEELGPDSAVFVRLSQQLPCFIGMCVYKSSHPLSQSSLKAGTTSFLLHLQCLS